MRLVMEQSGPTESADVVALDWASLGRLVRIGTLDALAMHFAGVGVGKLSEDESPRGLKPAAQAG